jgi:hypothetical protein
MPQASSPKGNYDEIIQQIINDAISQTSASQQFPDTGSPTGPNTAMDRDLVQRKPQQQPNQQRDT